MVGDGFNDVSVLVVVDIFIVMVELSDLVKVVVDGLMLGYSLGLI